MVASLTLRRLDFVRGRDASGLRLMDLMFASRTRVAGEHTVRIKFEEPFLTALPRFNPRRAAS
jgi:hypothetical protein